MRSNSGNPTWDANSLSCVETAGCERCSSSAAREKSMCRAAAANTRNCRSVTFFMPPAYPSSRYSQKLMVSIEIFNFSSDTTGGTLTARCMESAMPDVNQAVVGAYVERNQAHLLRVYDKAFLRNLVLSAKDRCRRESQSPAW